VTYVRALHLPKHDNRRVYEPVDEHVYRRLADGQYVVAVSLVLEERERAFLVIEDIMLEYTVSATGDTTVEPNGDLSILNIEFEGAAVSPQENLANIRRIARTVGLRAHEVIVSADEIKLVFERETSARPLRGGLRALGRFRPPQAHPGVSGAASQPVFTDFTAPSQRLLGYVSAPRRRLAVTWTPGPAHRYSAPRRRAGAGVR